MKLFRAIAVSLSVAILMIAAVAAEAKNKSPFQGRWAGIDGDGSNLTMSFRAQNTSNNTVFQVTGADDAAFCYLGPCQKAQMAAVGVLENGNAVHVQAVWWAENTVDPLAYFVDDSLTYDASTDTLTDNGGIVYHRSSGDD